MSIYSQACKDVFIYLNRRKREKRYVRDGTGYITMKFSHGPSLYRPWDSKVACAHYILGPRHQQYVYYSDFVFVKPGTQELWLAFSKETLCTLTALRYLHILPVIRDKN